MSATKSTSTVSVLAEAPVLRRETGAIHLRNVQTTRSSPRPYGKFRTKHNWNRFLPPTKPYFGFGFWTFPLSGSPTGDGWLRRNSNEKMRPMSRKTRIRCPLPQSVERPLVDSRSLLFDPLRGSSWAGATRTPNIAGTHLSLSQ